MRVRIKMLWLSGFHTGQIGQLIASARRRLQRSSFSDVRAECRCEAAPAYTGPILPVRMWLGLVPKRRLKAVEKFFGLEHPADAEAAETAPPSSRAFRTARAVCRGYNIKTWSRRGAESG